MNFSLFLSQQLSDFGEYTTRHLHTVALSICAFHEIQRTEGCIFLLGISKVTFTCIPCMISLKSRKPSQSRCAASWSTMFVILLQILTLNEVLAISSVVAGCTLTLRWQWTWHIPNTRHVSKSSGKTATFILIQIYNTNMNYEVLQSKEENILAKLEIVKQTQSCLPLLVIFFSYSYLLVNVWQMFNKYSSLAHKQ